MAERTPRATDTDGLLLGGLNDTARIGEYVIEAQLPTRGTGHLYLATHLVLPRRATIKVLQAALAGSRELSLEVLREACILDAVDHPGAPRLYESGMRPDRRPWVAIEQVDGPPIEAALDASTFPATSTIALVRDVADILAYVHAQGVIHCNVVPAAIVIPARPRHFPLCLVDWSAARTHDSTRPAPFVSPQASLGYLSPEQLRGELIDGVADVFALGMIASELCSEAPGEPPPPMFLALIEHMIDPEPTRRPTSAEVRDAASWLCSQLGAIPYTVSDITTRQRSQPITSDDTVEVTGEIDSERA
jgi:serine/threonine-protein kinase